MTLYKVFGDYNLVQIKSDILITSSIKMNVETVEVLMSDIKNIKKNNLLNNILRHVNNVQRWRYKGSNIQRRSVDVHLIKVFTFLLKGVDHPFEHVHFTSYNFIILKLFLKFTAKAKTQLSYFYYNTTSVSFRYCCWLFRSFFCRINKLHLSYT